MGHENSESRTEGQRARGILRGVSWVADGSEAVCRLACILLFSVMIVSVSYEVLMRYMFNAPTFWSEALARGAMVWLVLLGMALGIRYQDQIRVDFLLEVAPRRVQTAFAIVRYAVTLIFAGVLVVYGMALAIPNLRQTTPGLEIPVFYIYLAVPVSAVLMILYLLELILRREIRPF